MSQASRGEKSLSWILVAVSCLLVGGALLYASTLATRNFPINGIYWISLPASPSPPLTNAEELLASLPFQTVARYRTETDTFHTWDGVTCTPGIDPEATGAGAPCTTACFCIIPGEGYQVQVNTAPVSWVIEGFDGVTVYPLRGQGAESLSGSHLISLPIQLAHVMNLDDALDLTNDIEAKAGSPTFVTSVSRYVTENDSLITYPGTTPLPFVLVPGDSYMVKVGNGSLDYTPPQPDSQYTNPCIAPAVNGTIDLPPAGCGYFSADEVHRILVGLPSGTEVNLDASHQGFFNITRSASRSPAGTTTETFDSDLVLHITGTGNAAFVDCMLTMPALVIVESDPTQPGQDVQEFDTNMRSLSGQVTAETQCNLFTDLIVHAGSDYGLPSPGHTRLVRRPDGTFAVDSYFDVQSTISFVGQPLGPLAGSSGSTTLTVRMGTRTSPGDVLPCDDPSVTPPECNGLCPSPDECQFTPSLQRCACRPTLVTLEYFTAQAEPGGVRLRWKTTSEIDNYGFRILLQRPKEGPVAISPLIATQGNDLVGAEYEYFDTSRKRRGKTYTYYLQDLDNQGVSTVRGEPVEVVIQQGRLRPVVAEAPRSGGR